MSAPQIITIALSWPDGALSPNGRPKLRDKIRAVRTARNAAWALTREAMGRDRIEAVTAMRVLWCPPDRRSRDDDNLVARFKSQRDGIAQALGVDDATFRPVHDFSGPIIRGGRVIVTIEAISA